MPEPVRPRRPAAPTSAWRRPVAAAHDQAALALHLGRTALLGATSGVLAGLAAAGFLLSLDRITAVRERHPALLLALPVLGFAVGLAYDRVGGRAALGNNLVVDEVHEPSSWLPRRMAPLVLVGTLLTHLGGGSAGREGTAIQLSASLTDGVLSRALRLAPAERRLLLVASIAGGFGAVFGVPLAGCVFGMEVLAIGTLSYEALVPALAASVTGDQVVRALGVHHAAYPQLVAHVDARLLGEVAVAGVAFGLVGTAFAAAVHLVKAAWAWAVPWAPARPLLGGCVVVAAVLALGASQEEGLSLGLITRSLAGGAGVPATAWLVKLVLTALTLGAGFQGGEVTPLFVIGATLGAVVGRAAGLPVPVLAAVGFVAVFAGATNTPLACTVMGVELFGRGMVVPLAVGCVVAYACSSHRGIYASQRVGVAKGRWAPSRPGRRRPPPA